MSALGSIKKRMREITPKERDDIDRRIVGGVYKHSIRDVRAARARLDAAKNRPSP